MTVTSPLYTHLVHSIAFGLAITACGLRLPWAPHTFQDARRTCPHCLTWETAARQHAEENA